MKKSNANPIDELMKNQFLDFQPEVPEGVWENISEDLDAQKSNLFKRNFLRIAIAAIVLYSIGTIFYYLNTTTPQLVPIANTLTPVKVIEKQEIHPQTKEIANVEPQKLNKRKTKIVSIPKETISIKPVLEPSKAEFVSVSKNIPEDYSSPNLNEKPATAIAEISTSANEVLKNKKTIELNSVANVLQTLVNRFDKRKEKIIDIKRADHAKGTGSLSINLGLIKIKRTSSIN